MVSCNDEISASLQRVDDAKVVIVLFPLTRRNAVVLSVFPMVADSKFVR